MVAHIAESDEVEPLSRSRAPASPTGRGSARTRTMAADELVERLARSLVRRRPRRE